MPREYLLYSNGRGHEVFPQMSCRRPIYVRFAQPCLITGLPNIMGLMAMSRPCLTIFPIRFCQYWHVLKSGLTASSQYLFGVDSES